MLSRIVSVPFETAARLRHGRALHRRGRTYAATLRVTEPLPGLAAERPYDVIARLSKALSTPGGVPDILGVALRVSTDDGPLDLLFASTGRLPGLRHVLLPRASYTQGAYTTLLPYDVAGETRVLALLPTTRRTVRTGDEELNAEVAVAPLTFALATATLTGPWRTRGVLEVRQPPVRDLPDAFDPQLNRLPGLHPTGPFQSVREAAYDASRRGRHEPAPKAGSPSRR
ncbi:hypothetical protein [Actinomadura kijaniata]|uniref:hypothetical protein n=1 Tax=Actinomadura kijaniata TaxID=46161 RepID=UPI00082AEF35|nr:hypothetical protein [Actinomadura kijaniata]